MASHSAKSLFDMNIQSAVDCLDLFDGLSKLKVSMNLDWLLRASVVFIVSAIDTFFHDKVKYRVGRFSLNDLPPQLASFQVPIRELTVWEEADRKGNVLRNWVTEHLSTRPLQSKKAIIDALKLAGIDAVWDTIEPNKTNQTALLNQFNQLVKRRNQIAHEGDREQSRRSGKKLRPIKRDEVKSHIDFAIDLVAKIEVAFPK